MTTTEKVRAVQVALRENDYRELILLAGDADDSVRDLADDALRHLAEKEEAEDRRKIREGGE